MRYKFLIFPFTLLIIYQILRFLISLSEFDRISIRNFSSDDSSNGHKSGFNLSHYSDFNNEEERIERQKVIQAGCLSERVNSIDQLSPKEKNMLLNHVIVSDKYKFLYCYTPKVACSNWKKVVKVLHGELDSINVGGKMDHSHGMKFLRDYTEEEINHKLENYFKFMFVRNPLERLLSAYRNKFGEIEVYMRRYGPEIIDKYRNARDEEEEAPGKIPGDDVTFEEFVKYLVGFEPPELMNEHWAPMVTLCQPCIIKYDFVGSYDHLYEDSEAILEKIKAPDHIHFPARQRYYTPTTYATTAYFYSLVNPKSLFNLCAKYAKDFKIFSFPFIKISQPSIKNNHIPFKFARKNISLLLKND